MGAYSVCSCTSGFFQHYVGDIRLCRCVCWWILPLVSVAFQCVKNHPLFVYSAVNGPRLVFRGDLGTGSRRYLRWRSKGRPVSPRLRDTVQVSLSKPHAGQLLFPGAWFVQKPRGVATVSRQVPQEEGPEPGGLLFLWEQNLLAELFLQGVSQICVHEAGAYLLGYRQGASIPCQWGPITVVSTRGKPPPGMLGNV